MASSHYVFNDSTDAWGRSQRRSASLQPLSFERVMENRSPAAAHESRLFMLPVEILDKIVKVIPESALASLAMVNSDCRQLARSRQFAAVELDYNDASIALVDLLASEVAERAGKQGQTSRPSLGVCIKQLTACIRNTTIEKQFDMLSLNHYFAQNYDTHTISEKLKSDWKIADTEVNPYRAKVLNILSHRQSLPYIEYLDLEGLGTFTPSFHYALKTSPIHHLKLHDLHCTSLFEIMSPSIDHSRVWPLRTLHIEWARNIYQPFRDASAGLTGSVLLLCASTLETLTWTNSDLESKSIFAPGSVPEFPRLRYLRLGTLNAADITVLRVFLNSKLFSLLLAGVQNSSVDEALESRGCIPSLKILAMDRPPTKFLEANAQLSKIDISCNASDISTKTLHFELPPNLVTFTNLMSLRVTWPEEGSIFPKQSIQVIGRLQNLTQLCIICGSSDSWRRTWEVDHIALREGLFSLGKLKRFAVRGDTYPGFSIAEKSHVRHMRTEVEKYMDILPGLEWMYLGECGMHIKYNESLTVYSNASATEIKNMSSYLTEMFGDGPETADRR